MDDIGARIAKLRDMKAEQCGRFTQQDLADAMGVEKGTIYKWEHGLTQLNAEKIVELAHFFNVSCEYLLQGGPVEYLKTMSITGLSADALELLSDPNCPPYVSKTINALVKYPFLLLALHEYVFGNFSSYDASDRYSIVYGSMERIAKLCVLEAAEKLREMMQNGEH